MSKALIIASDNDSRYLYQVAIRFQKIEVEAANSLKEGLSLLLSKIFDIIILDLETIDATDKTFLEDLKTRRKKLPMIIMTEQPLKEAQKKTSILGSNQVIPKKGASIGALVRTVRKTVKK